MKLFLGKKVLRCDPFDETRELVRFLYKLDDQFSVVIGADGESKQVRTNELKPIQ